MFLQKIPKQTEPVVNPRAERRLADAQDGGHLVVAELLRVPQNQRLAHPLGKPRERVVNAVPSLLQEELVDLFGSGRFGGLRGGPHPVALHHPAHPRMVATAIARRRNQPDDELALGPILGSLGPNRDPGLLGNFGTPLAIVDEPGAGLHQALGVALDERSERFAHSGLRERHQFVVVAIGQGATWKRHQMRRRHSDGQNTARTVTLTGFPVRVSRAPADRFQSPHSGFGGRLNPA